uniref:Uncharacterized protein n=1 Tax=Glossina pallidipes TaxID=7398 RepID=A0A1A9ZIL8_GLOPL
MSGVPLIKFIEPQSKSNRINFNKLSRQMGRNYASNKEQMLLFHFTDSLDYYCLLAFIELPDKHHHLLCKLLCNTNSGSQNLGQHSDNDKRPTKKDEKKIKGRHDVCNEPNSILLSNAQNKE